MTVPKEGCSSEAKDSSFSLVTAHFGSEFWIKELIKRANAFSEGLLEEIFIVDQNRGRPPISLESKIPVQVLRVPKNTSQFAALGHDHPGALQRAIDSIRFRSQRVVVMDSDCLPLSTDWIKHIGAKNETILAGDPSKWGLTHPCFMSIPVASLKDVDFAEGVLTVGIDTGRLVGHQLVTAGRTVRIDQPVSAPWGRGHFYLQGTLYHHGSGSLRQIIYPNRGQRLENFLEQLYLKKVQKSKIGTSRSISILKRLSSCLQGTF